MHPFILKYVKRHTVSGNSDPYFSNVVLLLHFDGVDASTSFTDVKGHIVTPSGNAQIDTAQSKFGGASGLFDGTGDYLTIADNVDWDLPGDFTIEGWFRTSTPYIPILAFGNYIGSIDIDYQGYLKSSVGYGGDVTSTTLVNDGSWHHFAVVRNSNSVTLYLDGINCGSTSSSSTLSPTGIYIGTNEFQNISFNGHLDDIRITKGIARYTVDFTPPTAAFPNA